MPTPSMPEPKNNNQLILIIAIIATFLITGGTIFLWQKTSTDNQWNNQYQSFLHEQEKIISTIWDTIINEGDNKYHQITFEKNPRIPLDADIYDFNPINGDEILIGTLNNFYSEQHPGSLYNRPIYYNRNIYYHKLVDDLTELWKYNLNYQEEKKIFSFAENFFFKVAPNEKYISIAVKDQGKLIVINIEGRIEKEFTIDQLIINQQIQSNTNLQLLGWSSDSQELWGMSKEYNEPTNFFKINLKNWEITTYKYYDIQRYCLNNNDCVIQQTSCNNCGCPIAVNKDNYQPLNCNYEPERFICLIECGAIKEIICKNYQCTTLLYD